MIKNRGAAFGVIFGDDLAGRLVINQNLRNIIVFQRGTANDPAVKTNHVRRCHTLADVSRFSVHRDAAFCDSFFHITA